MGQSSVINRRNRFFEQMDVESFAVLFAGEAPHKTTDQHYPFTVNKHFFYLTGLVKQSFILVLIKGLNKQFVYLFIEESSEYATKWLGKRMTKAEASAICGISEANIMYLEAFPGFLTNQVLGNSRKSIIGAPKRLYIDLYRHKPLVRSYGFLQMDSFIQAYPELSIHSANEILDQLRMFKDETEIFEMSQAITYAKSGLEAIMKKLKPGLGEQELDSLFEYQIKRLGSTAFIFNPIIASGAIATTLHFEDNKQVMNDGSLVLCDLGALSNEYASDITRTYPVNGTFTPRQKELYELVLSVNKASIAFVKPGITMAQLNAYAKNLLAEGALALGLIKEITEIDKYYYHNVSHYLGLDVHDVGTYHEPLKPGIVLTIEPGIYVDEEQIGIRIEDDVLVTEQGYQNLSIDIIKEITDIEAYIKS
ncbi:MAG: Xaa-Pro aminopeptidase [bacterium]|nr:Xaa-Pro aminopeptidase [bacterium]